MYQRFIKRILDCLFAVLLGALALPALLLLALAVRLTSPGPAIFRQKRYGRNGREFTVYKFRTMMVDTPKDRPTNSLRNPEMYITPIGRIMRKLSVDELPQLINVIRGDMSMVGPRPVVLSEADLIAERKKNGSYALHPGLTGWAQVNGRDELRLKEKARMDGEYAEKFGIVMDMKCLALTLWAVLSVKGHHEGFMETEESNG